MLNGEIVGNPNNLLLHNYDIMKSISDNLKNKTMKNPFEKLERKYDKMKAQRDEARAELLTLRTVQVTIEPSEEYEVKSMHIDCEKKEKYFEVGKWYKCHLANAKARFTEKGNYNSGYSHDIWIKDLGMVEGKYWEEMTPEEIKEALTKRCKELGLFDGEFECLQGMTSIEDDKKIMYGRHNDKLWIGNQMAYEKGKFAKLIEKKKPLLKGISPKGYDCLSDKSIEAFKKHIGCEVEVIDTMVNINGQLLPKAWFVIE